MEFYNYVIVGSGPAGVAAARRLQNEQVCIVDVGHQPKVDFPYPSLLSALEAGDKEALLGKNWEMLANIVEPQRRHPKLRAAALRYLLNGERFQVRDKTGDTILSSAVSQARGGMSNAWGGQLLRYTETDLQQAGGWPISVESLNKYYEDLEDHIGIAGQIDDMNEFLGESSLLLPPVPAVPAAERLYSNYLAGKKRDAKQGLVLGRPRIALATERFRNVGQFDYGETEFLTTGQQGLYTAQRTLGDLISNSNITYLGQHKLIAYTESSDYVELNLLNTETGIKRIIRTRHLLLGCGTIQTTKLVLLNNPEITADLPFLDHQPTLIPVFLPSMFGSALPTKSYPVQLVGSTSHEGRDNMISFYYPGTLLWSDLLPDIPLPMNSALKVLRNVLGGMLVAQIWEPSTPRQLNKLRIDETGEVVIEYPNQADFAKLNTLLAALRPLGGYTVKRLASKSPPGWGFHHAGCLPMKTHPDAFETHTDGRLWSSQRIRVIDGSSLPSLPAKNHTFTLMANAARIADKVSKCGY